MLVDWTRIQYFTQKEMACKCGCDLCEMDHDYMTKLDWLRRNLGFPLIVNSGYRCSDYDKSIGGAGVHPTGHGSDIHTYGRRTYQLIELASKAGITGIGINQKGTRHSRFVHLDDLPDGDHPRPWVWNY